eukprot:COSAG01_NODE_3259_length_6338_cov_3.955281_7_plen_71_part_00
MEWLASCACLDRVSLLAAVQYSYLPGVARAALNSWRPVLCAANDAFVVSIGGSDQSVFVWRVTDAPRDEC